MITEDLLENSIRGPARAAADLGEKRLIVLGCSQTKRDLAGNLPAIVRYDGPLFRVLRTFLRERNWPPQLSVAVLSAQFGLIGGLKQIPDYNQRLTPGRAHELRESVTTDLQRLLVVHRAVDLFMGREYLSAINLESLGGRVRFIDGAIGIKLNRLRTFLNSLPVPAEFKRKELTRRSNPLYFLPDWDDFLDQDYDFENDIFSNRSRSERREAHSLELMRPQRLADGILVSLAQHLGSKGMLKRMEATSADALTPKSVQMHFSLAEDQWAFGDCGAFSYVNEPEPIISVEQAVAAYNIYGFDLGASVDHIPVTEIWKEGKKVSLDEEERRERVNLTKRNAENFILLAKSRRAKFRPVGVIQGLRAADYAGQVRDYVDMGYEYLALGGLVPRSDADVLAIVQSVSEQLESLDKRPWLHLMGVFRPKLQQQFRRLRIDSFDSASYFRKAWLRSDQNYLGPDGKWYAAVRVPPSKDPRTAKRLLLSGLSESEIQELEKQALQSLRLFDRGVISLEDCLDAVVKYDSLLSRAEAIDKRLLSSYRQTLEAKPWKRCLCRVCSGLGIEVIIFRGLNRNKRRGAHNTWQLYRTLQSNSG